MKEIAPAIDSEVLLSVEQRLALKDKARTETLIQWLAQIRSQLPAQIAAELAIVGLAWKHADHAALFCWLGVALLLHRPLELWAIFYARRHPVQDCQAPRWRALLLFIGTTNTLLGCFAYYAFGFNSPQEELFLVLTIGFMFTMGHFARKDLIGALFLVGPTVVTMLFLHLNRGLEKDYILTLMIILFFGAVMGLVLQQSKQHEEALYARYLSEELSRVLALKNAEVTQAKLDAEVASQAKSRFFAAASHDLRQPLHVLGLLLGSMQERNRQDHLQPLLTQMETALQSLGNYFEEVLNVSRLEGGQTEPRFEAIRTDDLLSALAFEFAPMAREKGLALRVRTSSLLLRSDRAMLERILRNLIGNAFKYTERGAVLIACRRGPGACARIQIFDTGIGILPHEQRYIFEDFYQAQLSAPQSHLQEAGLGLGLGIVKRLADLLGHCVSVRSKPGRGSVFELRLPLAGAMSEAPAADVPAPVPSLLLAGRTLLVLDDDQAVCSALADLLGRWGAQVSCASDMATLHAVLQGMPTSPDFVIADFQFDQGFSGADALSAVRRHFQGLIPAAILTGNVSMVPAEIIADPSLKVFPKPFSPAKLRALLHHSLSNPTPHQVH